MPSGSLTGVTITGNPSVGSTLTATPLYADEWQVLLTDIKTDQTIADLSSAYLSWTLSPRANRSLGFVLNMASNSSLLKTLWDDLDPNLWVGTRALKVYNPSGLLVAHNIVWNLGYAGTPAQAEETPQTVQITTWDPIVRLMHRQVWDGTAHIADQIFSSPMSGAEILRTAIDSSVINEDLDIGAPALLPIDTATGTFDTTVPPATDLSAQLVDSPMLIGDLITTLTDTGAVDVVMVPVDSSMGYDPGIMSQLNVVNQAGSDKSSSVHFQYGVGTKNVSGIRRVFDMDSVRNRVVYELGPKLGHDRWQGNITGTETSGGTTENGQPTQDLSSYQALQLASRAKYGTMTSTRVYDSAAEWSRRPLFYKLWKTEVTLGVNPRELLYMTPQAGLAPEPFDHYNVYDVVKVSTDDSVGPAISGAHQRIYGFDVTFDAQESVARVGELITSADAE